MQFWWLEAMSWQEPCTCLAGTPASNDESDDYADITSGRKADKLVLTVRSLSFSFSRIFTSLTGSVISSYRSRQASARTLFQCSVEARFDVASPFGFASVNGRDDRKRRNICTAKYETIARRPAFQEVNSWLCRPKP